jgi:hypothetical protein
MSMRPVNVSGKRPRRWAGWLGLALLAAVPAVALVVLGPNPFAAAAGGEADLAAVRDGISGNFLVLDAPGTAHAVRATSKGAAGENSADTEVETRLNNWTPTLTGGSRGN